jgi:hypothetical protein
MRCAVAGLITLTIATVATPALAQNCAGTPIQVSSERIDSILKERNRDQRHERMAELGEYWMLHCRSVREAADSSVVEQLSRLLAFPETRFFVATMLVDLDPNSLDAVRTRLETVLADERARYERSVRANGGLAWNLHVLPAMECIEHKLNTGVVNQELCENILGSRDPDGIYDSEGEPR